MDARHVLHLVIVGALALSLLVGLGVWLRKSHPRGWWAYPLVFVVFVILSGGRFSVR